MEKIIKFYKEYKQYILNAAGIISFALVSLVEIEIIQNIELIKWTVFGVGVLGYFTNLIKKGKK